MRRFRVRSFYECRSLHGVLALSATHAVSVPVPLFARGMFPDLDFQPIGGLVNGLIGLKQCFQILQGHFRFHIHPFKLQASRRGDACEWLAVA